MTKTIDGGVEQFLYDGTDPIPFVSVDLARVGILPIPLEKTVSYLLGTSSAPTSIIEVSRQVELFDPELNTSPYLVGIHTYPPIACSRNTELVLTIAPVSVLLKHNPDLTISSAQDSTASIYG